MLTKAECQDIVDRNEKGTLRDGELASFIELRVASLEELDALRKAGTTVLDSFTGEWTLTVANVRLLNAMFKRWNATLGAEVFHRY